MIWRCYSHRVGCVLPHHKDRRRRAVAGKDMAFVLVFADVERREGAVQAARRNHRHLALEGDEAFQNGWRPAEPTMQREEVGPFSDQRLALAVIAETPRLEDRRTTQRRDRAHQGAGVLDGEERGGF